MGDVTDSAEASEQRYIDRLYARLDELRTQTATRLADVRQEQTRHHQALYERDVEVHRQRVQVGETTQKRVHEAQIHTARPDRRKAGPWS